MNYVIIKDVELVDEESPDESWLLEKSLAEAFEFIDGYVPLNDHQSEIWYHLNLWVEDGDQNFEDDIMISPSEHIQLKKKWM